MKKFLHKLGFHFWKKSGAISRTCSYCGKKQYWNFYTTGEWFDEESK